MVAEKIASVVEID